MSRNRYCAFCRFMVEYMWRVLYPKNGHTKMTEPIKWTRSYKRYLVYG